MASFHRRVGYLLLFIWLLAACSPKPLRPKGPVPVPVLATPTFASSSVTQQKIDTIHRLCLQISQSGDMATPADDRVIAALKLAGREVISKDCEAMLSITLKTTTPGATPVIAAGGSKNCYLRATALATFTLTVQGDLLAETPELRVDYETPAVIIHSCASNQSEAPYSAAVDRITAIGAAYLWGPTELDVERIVMPDFQKAYLSGPQRARFTPVLLAAAEADPTNESVYQGLGELGADGGAAISFLTDVARSDRQEAQSAALALTRIYESLYPDVHISPVLNCDWALQFPKVTDLDLITQVIDQEDRQHYFQRECGYAAAARLGTQAAPLVSKLVSRLEQGDISSVEAAKIMSALGSIGPEAITAVPGILTYWMKHPNESLPPCSLTLQRITGQNLSALPEVWVEWWNGYLAGVPTD